MEKKEITEVFEISDEASKEIGKSLKNIAGVKGFLEKQDDTNITGFLEALFLSALGVDASDIHI